MSGILELFPRKHFGEALEEVIQEIITGESVGVYGMYGIGMQYAFKHLRNRLRDEHNYKHVLAFKGALIRDNPIREIKRAIGYELHNNPEDFALAITQLGDQKLVLILDGLEHIAQQAKLNMLDFLDALRKSSSGNIVNVIGLDFNLLTHDFSSFKSHSATISSIIRLDLFDIKGTMRIVEKNNRVYGWETPTSLIPKIHNLTAGNARLIKYLSKTLAIHGPELIDDLPKLVSLEPLLLKLHRFAEICLTHELGALKQLRIINDKGEVFSPLVDQSLKDFSLPSIEILNMGLSMREKKILSMLYLNRGRVVSRDSLDYIMNLSGDNYSLWGSYKAIDRLRKKISPMFELKTVRGEGYVLNTLTLKEQQS